MFFMYIILIKDKILFIYLQLLKFKLKDKRKNK